MPPPVLFVHGLGLGAWSWEEHFAPYFRERGFDVTALDLRGHGTRRGAPLRFVPLAAYVDDVRQAAAAFAEPPIIVGHSMGGAIVQRYLSGGGRAAACVLVASVPQHGAIGATLRIARAHPARFVKVNLTWSFKPMIATPDAWAVFFGRSMPRAELERLHPKVQDESYRAYVDMLLMAASRPRPSQVPMLVVAASEDALFTPAVERGLANYHGADFELFEGMGHSMMLEPAWESVASRIERFVAVIR